MARTVGAARVRLASATVVRRQECTDDLFRLWLKPSIPFAFTSGQYITIGAGGIERPYSIVSAPYEPFIELFIENLPEEHGGHLAPLLHALRVGDTLTMRPDPKGRFTRRPGVANHVMVATVTGIAPYVSIIRQFVHDRARGADPAPESRFFVLHGASFQDEFVYDAELRRLVGQHPDSLTVVCSVSRPWAPRNAGWTGPVGRVNDLVEDYLERWSLPLHDTAVYLCGHPGMIEDAFARLSPRGWSVVSERFWRQ